MGFETATELEAPPAAPSATPSPATAPLRRFAASLAALTAAAASLEACGGGAGDSPAPSAAPPSAAEAARFLAQASMGASRAQIDSVQSLGYAGWLDAQFALPASTSRRDWLVAAGVDAQPALTQALDAIFAHADGAPFFARQLIQRLVTSNPSGACVTRVATVFNNNGSGAKGDLKAVIKAVLLDDEARSAFCKPTVELGASNQVTAFTASDFGRTATGNDGSDHGRGSMHFMLGGAVNGGRFYGTAPAVANNRPDDVGQGRLLPSTSVDQYAATLGKWFGISDSDLLTVLPNLVNWNASQRNLGFV